jgi:hypothetical protein
MADIQVQGNPNRLIPNFQNLMNDPMGELQVWWNGLTTEQKIIAAMGGYIVVKRFL